MTTSSLEGSVRSSLEQYLRDLGGTEPSGIYDLIVSTVERPMLEVVLAHAQGNQSRAAQWLGINRNTLRRKLADHQLL